jgi:AcrR family transcriptional regulator
MVVQGIIGSQAFRKSVGRRSVRLVEESLAAEDAKPTRRGRPLAADRTDAILDAASALFDEVGYDQLTVQDIAGRAGVGLATLYRRWPTKQALLADALRRRNDTFDLVLDGGPLDVLETVFSLVAEGTMGPQGAFLPGLLAAIRADDELAEALRIGIIDPLRRRIRLELEAALGADHPQVDLLVDLVPGICVFRALAPGEPGDPDELVSAALSLVAGLAAAREIDVREAEV